MKLATQFGARADGALVVVSRDLTRAAPASAIAPTMVDALENWDAVSADLERLFAALQAGTALEAFPLDIGTLAAPLPRAPQWLDGSVFPTHGQLMIRAFGIDDPTPDGWPLMYQGLSDRMLPPHGDVPFRSEADGIDFEGEFAVALDHVPMGCDAVAALGHVKLILLANDWSLRAFGGDEMRAGFGFIRAKPATAFAPIAVTPDELGAAWDRGTVALDLRVHRGGTLFGHANGREMAFHFGDLIAHAAYNRELSGGTIIGSGTVSNAAYDEVGSSCIAERRSIEMIRNGKAETSYLMFGEQVRLEALDEHGGSVFGTIDQTVVASEANS
jgi:fumarylacetoacetate (FAA) hydrolase